MSIPETEIKKFIEQMEKFFYLKEKYPGAGWSWSDEEVEEAESAISNIKKGGGNIKE